MTTMTLGKSLAKSIVFGAALALAAALQAAGPADSVCVGIEVIGPGQPVTGQTVPFPATKVVDLASLLHGARDAQLPSGARNHNQKEGNEAEHR